MRSGFTVWQRSMNAVFVQSLKWNFIVAIFFSFVALAGSNNLWAGSKIAAGGVHSIAVKSDGTVWAWGTYYYLGDDNGTNSNTPMQVSGLTGVVSVATGYAHSLVVKSDGTVWAWGDNSFGQLGDGTTTRRIITPVQVSGLTGVVVIAAGHGHSLAVKSDGTVWAWGGNGFGKLGDGTTTNRSTPVQVSGLTGVVAVAAGYAHSLAVKSDGTVWAWGWNRFGELGDGTYTGKITPVQVSGLAGVIAIAAKGYHSHAVKSDGTVWGWGWNLEGHLGDGTTTNRSTPVQVSGLTGVVAMATGDGHSLAVKSDGTVWAWGLNYEYGELGDGTYTDSNTPVQVSGLTGVVDIAAGYAHSLAVKSDCTVWAWGWNGNGQLGDGTTTNRSTPVQVSGIALCATTAVELIEFKARVSDECAVTLTWETATEVDNAGFNLYRSRLRDDNYKKINDTLILAQGGATSGASYRYEDTPPARGTYYYKLEDVDTKGVSTMHGLEKVRVRK